MKLTPELAYLLGLFIGRGRLLEDNGSLLLKIFFPFTDLEEKTFGTLSLFASALLETFTSKFRRLPDTPAVSVEEDFWDKGACLLIEVSRKSSLGKLFFSFIDVGYSNYTVPDAVMNSGRVEIIEEFLRGFGDVSANIRRSNRDANALHRVYVDVLFSNWKLPVQLCTLFQDELKIPVANILWSHPNLRGEDVLGREHQVRIYAHEYVRLGFSLEYKQRVLQELAGENRRHPKYLNFVYKFCEGGSSRSSRRKRSSPLEESEKLPPEIRGKHFNAYWELCREFGCRKAKRGRR